MTTSHISEAIREELAKLNGEKAQRVLEVADERGDRGGRENDGRPESGLHRSTRRLFGPKR